MEIADILIWDHFNFFASNIICDVCVYFLRNLHCEEKEYTDRRSVLYSRCGQKFLIQCLDELSLEFLIEMKYDITFRIVDDRVFEEKVNNIINRSKWIDGTHSTFYETCAKIVVLGLVAMNYRSFPEAIVHEGIYKMAKEAYTLCKLDKDYDVIRKNSHSLVYTVFRLFGTDITEYISPVEQQIGGFQEFHFPDNVLKWIKDIGKNAICFVSSDENFRTMNREKFNYFVESLLNEYKRNRGDTSQNSNSKFLYLIINVSCISLYCANNSFESGVQLGLDNVTELILMEKRF